MTEADLVILHCKDCDLADDDHDVDADCNHGCDDGVCECCTHCEDCCESDECDCCGDLIYSHNDGAKKYEKAKPKSAPLDTITVGSNWIRTACCEWHKYDRCHCEKCPHTPFSAAARAGREIKVRKI